MVLKLDISRVSTNQRLLLILPDAVEVDERYDTQANAITDDDGDLGGHVTRRILLAEGLGANNIPSTIPNQVHSRHSRLLRVSRYITRDQTEQGDERGRAGLGEVVASEATGIVGQRQCDNEDHADHSSGKTDHGYEEAVAVFVACPAASNEEDDFDGAAWGAVEERFFGCVAEADDELGEEV